MYSHEANIVVCLIQARCINGTREGTNTINLVPVYLVAHAPMVACKPTHSVHGHIPHVYTVLHDTKGPNYLRDMIKEYTPTRSLHEA